MPSANYKQQTDEQPRGRSSGTIPKLGLSPPPQDTEATASPTSMVLNYLQSRGFQPTSDNVRRALEANARDPGVIPGLRSDVPATEADDQAAMRASRGGGSSLPVPPVPPGGSNATVPMDRHDDSGAGSPNTSAAPQASSGLDLSSLLLALPGARRMLGPEPGRPGGGEPNYQLGMPDRAPPAQLGSEPPALTGQEPPRLGQPTPPPAAESNPLETAITRAAEPALDGIRPYTPSPMDLAQQGSALPPGITETDATRAAVGNLNRNTAAETLNLPQTVPSRPVQPRVPPVDVVNPRSGYDALRLLLGRR